MEELAHHQGIIHKLCRLYFRDGLAREDAFQDILLNAWKAYPTFAGRSSFSTWLYRVALNTILMRVRASKTERREPRPKTEASLIAAPESAASTGDGSILLRRAIDSLDEAEKAIILLYLEEMPYRDIAEITGLTENHVGVKISRIKLKLKGRLGELEDVHG